MTQQLYARPDTIEEAVSLLSHGTWRLLAGGTDFYPAQGSRPIRDDILDLNGIAALRGFERTDAGIRIGARTTWSDIVRADLPPAFDGLKLAAREVGSVQIQNTGTVAGNLCNASPAADGVPALLTLDASVELCSAGGTRVLPLPDFILGNRRTALQPGELVTAVLVPASADEGRSTFLKLGARRYLVISIAMVAARIAIEGGRVAHAAVAVGACSEVARRLTTLEADLVGQAADASLARVVQDRHVAGLTPIGDVRADASYRKEAAREIVARALARLAGDAEDIAA
ncbi:FAD binding domain-containing protein [Mesorhizobium australicum]|uniref:CO or xanthine dehydrogenase, FAD-binding subunit n=1 Tax=Mesorhizobium australicum TaxID=536018 RepID=A0A1X7NLG5_9HYPH|nr:xanthine dehydrogenase family protein subunit M [Mesorhizobium australicum]SMH37866.1 CO or xanthine dehydrogenase, FAD-binding subunit [Mesorhizobium australicum]